MNPTALHKERLVSSMVPDNCGLGNIYCSVARQLRSLTSEPWVEKRFPSEGSGGAGHCRHQSQGSPSALKLNTTSSNWAPERVFPAPLHPWIGGHCEHER